MLRTVCCICFFLTLSVASAGAQETAEEPLAEALEAARAAAAAAAGGDREGAEGERSAPDVEPTVAEPTVAEPVIAEPVIAEPVIIEEPIAEEPAFERRIGRYSREPLPRFASLKAERVNFRIGPGYDFAVAWELNRKNLPVRVIGEHGNWRRVELFNGERGWINRSLLNAGRRYAIAADDRLEIFRSPEPRARIVLDVAPVTPVELRRCRINWCEVAGDGHVGWAPKRRLWGVEADDVFD